MNGIQYNEILSKYLVDSSQNKNVNTDYSSTEGVFYYDPPKEAFINSLVVVMKCIGNIGDGFGDGLALTNSLKFAVEDDQGNELKDLTNGMDILTNDDLKIIVDDEGAASAKNFIGSKYYKACYSAPIKLRDKRRLVLRVNDNMGSRVSELYFLVNGVEK